MTIASFCREQLLGHGTLSLDELTDLAVNAGVTRARNPQLSVLAAIRPNEIELLDGRWTTALWLLEGRCLTATQLPYRTAWYVEIGADLGLLGSALTTSTDELLPDGHVYCVRVSTGGVAVSTISTPAATPELAGLAERVAAITPLARYGDQRRTALRAVAQLMLDDPSSFREPLPPLSTWVPMLVEERRREDEEARRMAEWHEEDERRRRRQVVLDDCTAIEVELAAERAGLSVSDWVYGAISGALVAEPRRDPDPGQVVISLGDRRPWGRWAQ